MATGHLRKRGNSWQIVIEVGRDASGKRKRIYKSVRGTKKEAQRIMHEMIAEIDRGVYVEPKKVTVEEFLLYWLEGKKPNLAPRTYESYEMIVKKHLIPEFGPIELAKLQPLAIEEYKNKKLATLSNRTVLKSQECRRSVLSFLHPSKLICCLKLQKTNVNIQRYFSLCIQV